MRVAVVGAAVAGSRAGRAAGVQKGLAGCGVLGKAHALRWARALALLAWGLTACVVCAVAHVCGQWGERGEGVAWGKPTPGLPHSSDIPLLIPIRCVRPYPLSCDPVHVRGRRRSTSFTCLCA